MDIRSQRFLERAEKLFTAYDFDQPFNRYLKSCFNANRNMGARDRRETRDWLYSFFRIGNNLREHPLALRMSVGNFLCNSAPGNDAAAIITDQTSFSREQSLRSLDEKLGLVLERWPDFSLERIFPLTDQLSPLINSNAFLRSLLVQPRLWIRVRKNFAKRFEQELLVQNLPYTKDTELPFAFSFDSGTDTRKLPGFNDAWFEVQDVNSQATGMQYRPSAGEKWWDACAASGGKSLLLLDMEPGIQLHVSDTRASILHNLRTRFQRAGIKNFTAAVTDLEQEIRDSGERYDVILADLPCTGTGTWSRNPEWLLSENLPARAYAFADRQRKIIENLTLFLRPGGRLIYSTCSVLALENEQNILQLTERLPLTLEKSVYYEGAEKLADTLFISVLVKSTSSVF